MDQETILIPKYETVIIPQEEIDRVVSPDDFVPRVVKKKRVRLLKKVVHYLDCPTCQSVTGHRRKKGTVNQFSCCVCGHTIERFDSEKLKMVALIGTALTAIGLPIVLMFDAISSAAGSAVSEITALGTTAALSSTPVGFGGWGFPMVFLGYVIAIGFLFKFMRAC